MRGMAGTGARRRARAAGGRGAGGAGRAGAASTAARAPRARLAVVRAGGGAAARAVEPAASGRARCPAGEGRAGRVRAGWRADGRGPVAELPVYPFRARTAVGRLPVLLHVPLAARSRSAARPSIHPRTSGWCGACADFPDATALALLDRLGAAHDRRAPARVGRRPSARSGWPPLPRSRGSTLRQSFDRTSARRGSRHSASARSSVYALAPAARPPPPARRAARCPRDGWTVIGHGRQQAGARPSTATRGRPG